MLRNLQERRRDYYHTEEHEPGDRCPSGTPAGPDEQEQHRAQEQHRTQEREQDSRPVHSSEETIVIRLVTDESFFRTRSPAKPTR